MNIDPHMTQGLEDLTIRLGEAVARNTAGVLHDKIKAIKTNRNQKAQIQELEDIIDDLIDDKKELREIAKAYQEKFVAQQISQEEIKYITDTVIPLLRKLVESDKNSAAANARDIKQTLDILESLLSVEMLTVLQLVGFNFKQAIGEPLTLLLQRLITSQTPTNRQSELEQQKLVLAFNVELAKIAQNQDATERWERLRK